MPTVIDKGTLVPLGLIGGLLAVAAFVGAQNQKLETVASDVSAMKPALIQAQLDLASIKAVLIPANQSTALKEWSPNP